ncbi:hypothetical protein SAMN02910456_01430 [Ruminococcaceae bacterium YRB3002]|nr:hypothetical protein SAMN02910456_01430 [Ruminococcaceae bacterium YRB3002]
MKLAAALSERADIQKRIKDLAQRLIMNAKVQEGERPAEDPLELMKELESLHEQLENLISRINHTNNVTRCGDVYLTDLIARRDCLRSKILYLREFLKSAGNLLGGRYSKTEIKIYSTVSVAEIQKKVDGLSKEFRELDEIIQELNWTTELI